MWQHQDFLRVGLSEARWHGELLRLRFFWPSGTHWHWGNAAITVLCCTGNTHTLVCRGFPMAPGGWERASVSLLISKN